jgi:DNA gyrase subunit A
MVKKTNLEEYVKTKKKTGMAAITIKENDELAGVSLVKDEQIILVTERGMAIRFNSNEVTPSSRTTMGVKGITLNEEDKVVTALPVRNNKDNLALFSINGVGKRVDLSEIPAQKRGGKGLACYKESASSGKISAASLVENDDNILIIGDKSSICIEASELPLLGRATVGNNVIKDNKILSVSKV